MSYSIKAVTKGYANKQGLTKVFIQVIYNRMKVYAPTVIQIPVAGKSPLQKRYDAIIDEQKNEIEKRILDALRKDRDLTKDDLAKIVKGKVSSTNTIVDFIDTLCADLKRKLSDGRVEHYKGIATKIEAFEPGARIASVNVKWLQRFEKWLRTQPGRDGLMDGNTVQSKMTMMKAVCNYANKYGLIEESEYKAYKVPGYEQKLPTYLTESELSKIKAFIDNIEKPGHKLAGYYFLLSCYTGYRISDTKKFNYSEMVEDNQIVLRAQKNKNIIAIPIYKELQEILDFVKDHPFGLSEQKTREYVKEICSFVGIKKHVKYHSSRHSFAMFLIGRKFSIDEVAICLGDTREIAQIYARIGNPHLKKRFNELLG